MLLSVGAVILTLSTVATSTSCCPRGYFATYTVTQPASACSGTPVVLNTTQSSSINLPTGASGWLSSRYSDLLAGSVTPSTPPAGPSENWLLSYAPNSVCRWQLLVPAKHSIRVELVFMDTEKTNSKQDSLSLYPAANDTVSPSFVWAGQQKSMVALFRPGVASPGAMRHSGMCLYGL